MKSKSQKMQHCCFKFLKHSAEETGTRWVVFILSGVLYGWHRFIYGSGYFMLTILFAGSLLGLLISLRDKLALEYLKRHPEALTDSDTLPAVPAAPFNSNS
jgi:hypothetical protein